MSLVVSGLWWCVGRGFGLSQGGSNQVVKEFGQAGSVMEVKGDAVVGKGGSEAGGGPLLAEASVPGWFTVCVVVTLVVG